MKRMSEVFELPVGGRMFDKDAIYGADGNGEWVATFETDEQAELAAHAINHADALVDALESVVEMAWLISDDLADEFSARPEIVAAQKALAAYRGDK